MVDALDRAVMAHNASRPVGTLPVWVERDADGVPWLSCVRCGFKAPATMQNFQLGLPPWCFEHPLRGTQ